MNKSIEFYKNVLGLQLVGDMIMEGPEVEILTRVKDAKLRVVYFNNSENLNFPPVELIQFLEPNHIGKPYEKLNNVGISEVCFQVENIESIYLDLKKRGVQFLSCPQFFDLTSQGYGKSKAVYFKDIDGNILELIEEIK